MQEKVTVVPHQIREKLEKLDDRMEMLTRQLEEIAFEMREVHHSRRVIIKDLQRMVVHKNRGKP